MEEGGAILDVCLMALVPGPLGEWRGGWFVRRRIQDLQMTGTEMEFQCAVGVSARTKLPNQTRIPMPGSSSCRLRGRSGLRLWQAATASPS